MDTLESLDFPEDFNFREIMESDVLAAVPHFDSQARGSDSIPQNVVSNALPVLAPIFCCIFNLSLSDSRFPSDWKRLLVRALNSVSSPLALTDYPLFLVQGAGVAGAPSGV